MGIISASAAELDPGPRRHPHALGKRGRLPGDRRLTSCEMPGRLSLWASSGRLMLTGQLRPDRLGPALACVGSVHRACGIASAPKRADRTEDQPAAASAADEDPALQLIHVGKEPVVAMELSCEVIQAGCRYGEQADAVFVELTRRADPAP